MHRKGFLLVVVLLLAFCVMTGGCGGGGGGNEHSSNVPIPQPPPSTDPLPFNPYSVSGTWVGRNSEGTASGYGYTYQLKLRKGWFVCEILTVTEKDLTARVMSDYEWDAFYNSAHMSTIKIGTDGYVESALLTRLSERTFRYTYPDGRIMDFSYINEKTLYVRESGRATLSNDGGTYDYNVTYYMDKVQ